VREKGMRQDDATAPQGKAGERSDVMYGEEVCVWRRSMYVQVRYVWYRRSMYVLVLESPGR
jgi:hypothetical protein